MDSWAFRYIVRPYLQLVKGRNAATLLLIIQRNVQPGSLVYTDEWAAYKQNQGFGFQSTNGESIAQLRRLSIPNT